MAITAERKIDNVGRIVIPKDIRNRLGITDQTPLNVDCNSKGQIIITKRDSVCAICGTTKKLQPIKEKFICADCAEIIK